MLFNAGLVTRLHSPATRAVLPRILGRSLRLSPISLAFCLSLSLSLPLPLFSSSCSHLHAALSLASQSHAPLRHSAGTSPNASRSPVPPTPPHRRPQLFPDAAAALATLSRHTPRRPRWLQPGGL
eukprot:3451105-Rhodomonas_salina.1